MVTLEMIKQAQQNLKGVARMTPLISAPKIGENVSIKAENLQLTGSFKLRGAYNKISSLPQEIMHKVLHYLLQKMVFIPPFVFQQVLPFLK